MRYAIAFLAVLLCACTTVHFRSADEMQIAEAVFRSLYAKNASAEQANKVGASLCVNGKDPPPEFLARLKDLKPEALSCSDHQFDEQRGEIVKRGTSDPVISFWVSDISISQGTATASGSYYEAPLSSASYAFKLALVDGKWVVTARKMLWIS